MDYKTRFLPQEHLLSRGWERYIPEDNRPDDRRPEISRTETGRMGD